jgi:hypothetical protein
MKMKSFFLCLLGIIFMQLAYSADSKNIGSQPTKDEIVISKKLKTIDISKNEDVQNKRTSHFKIELFGRKGRCCSMHAN